MRERERRRASVILAGGPVIVAGLVLAGARMAAATTPVAPAGALFDPRRPPERELEMSVADGFTLAAVGDCIISRPLAPLLKREAAFAAVVGILREADAAFGNLETSIIDIRGFKGSPQGGADDWSLVSLPEVAQDLKALGLDLVSRANNHAMDWGVEGMRETGARLDEAGLVHAGAGETRAQARAARYLETGMGRVGLVSMSSSLAERATALPPAGEAPGRPGLNALRTTRTTIVTGAMMEALVGLGRSMETAGAECAARIGGSGARAPATAVAGTSASARGKPDEASPGKVPEEITLFDTTFRIGERPGYHYAMDPIDLAENLRSIRQGKQHSDFLVATIHAHETGLGCDEPGDFLPVFAHAAIDAGADAFLGHGVHHLGPIEIYKGRPIFYGLGNFIWSDIQEPIAADLYERHRDLLAAAFGDPSKATDADLTALLNAAGFNDELVFQTIVAVSRFAGGRLSEIRLYPVDLGYGLKLTKSGVPRRAAPALARTILERLQRISRPYGTTIGIEDNVGLIRPR